MTKLPRHSIYDHNFPDDDSVFLKGNGQFGIPPGLSDLVPTGTIVMYADETPPDGWLLCNGASLLRVSYPDLFAIIGTNYGAADGDHFSLPQYSGFVPRGI